MGILVDGRPSTFRLWSCPLPVQIFQRSCAPLEMMCSTFFASRSSPVEGLALPRSVLEKVLFRECAAQNSQTSADAEQVWAVILPAFSGAAELPCSAPEQRGAPQRTINGGLSYDRTLCNLCRRPACGLRESVRRHPTSSGSCSSACPPAAKMARRGFASCQPRSAL